MQESSSAVGWSHQPCLRQALQAAWVPVCESLVAKFNSTLVGVHTLTISHIKVAFKTAPGQGLKNTVSDLGKWPV